MALPARSNAPADGVHAALLLAASVLTVPAIVPSVIVTVVPVASRTIVDGVPEAPAVTAVVT